MTVYIPVFDLGARLQYHPAEMLNTPFKKNLFSVPEVFLVRNYFFLMKELSNSAHLLFSAVWKENFHCCQIFADLKMPLNAWEL